MNIETNNLNDLPTLVALESLPDAIQGMIEAGIDPDYEAALAGEQAYCSGVASELTDGICPKCGAEDLPW